jgi:hypothetical protein
MQTKNENTPAATVSTAGYSKVIIILCFLLLISAIGNYKQYNSNSNLKSSLKNSTITLNTIAKDVRKQVDPQGNEHFIIKIDKNRINKEVALFSKTVDTIASAIGVKKNDITDYTKVSMQASDKNLTARIERDTLNKPAYRYTDKLFNLTYHPGPDSTSPGTFDASADLDLTWVNYTKRNWFLGAKHSYTDISSNDKRVTFKGANTLHIEQKTPGFGLRVRGASSYNFGTKTLSIGPEAAFDFGRNQVRINYYYNSASTNWRPTLTYTRDFVIF